MKNIWNKVKGFFNVVKNKNEIRKLPSPLKDVMKTYNLNVEEVKKLIVESRPKPTIPEEAVNQELNKSAILYNRVKGKLSLLYDPYLVNEHNNKLPERDLDVIKRYNEFMESAKKSLKSVIKSDELKSKKQLKKIEKDLVEAEKK